jgi:hypothetical protein
MKLSEVLKTKKGYVFIDTCSLDNDMGNMLDIMGFGNADAVGTNFETMVFECNKDGEVDDWGELDKENYITEEEAIEGHKKFINKWKTK